MLPPRKITARVVAQSRRIVLAQGTKRAMRRLELTESELAAFVMEAAGRLYADLDRSCASHDDVRAIHRRIVLLVLVAIEATRRAV